MQAACVKAQRDGRARKSVCRSGAKGDPCCLGICGVAADRGLEELSCRKDLPKEERLQLTQAKAEQEQQRRQQSRSKYR